MPWKDHLKDLRVWLTEGGISSWRRLMLTIWESSETHKEGNTLRGLTPNFHYWADANTRADTYKSSFNPENGLDARARMCKSALEDIYFSLFFLFRVKWQNSPSRRCYLTKANYHEDDINLVHLRIGPDSI